MSEYTRALKLQKDNFMDDALSLFDELLQTEILFEVIERKYSAIMMKI